MASLSHIINLDESPFSADNVIVLLLGRDELALLNPMKFQPQQKQGNLTRLLCIYNIRNVNKRKIWSHMSLNLSSVS